MTPAEAYRCFEAVLRLPLSEQAVCVRLAAEVSAPVWQEWCWQRGVEDRSDELLDTFGRWLAGAASDAELDGVARRFFETVPQDLREDAEPAGGYAGWALLDIATIALGQGGEVHHSLLHTGICFAAAAYCGIGADAASGTLDRLTACELEFLDSWWRRCCEQFPELARASRPA